MPKLDDVLQFYPSCNISSDNCSKESSTPSWLILKKGDTTWSYYLMDPYRSSFTFVWALYFSGSLSSKMISHEATVARPVINVYKSAIPN